MSEWHKRKTGLLSLVPIQKKKKIPGKNSDLGRAPVFEDRTEYYMIGSSH